MRVLNDHDWSSLGEQFRSATPFPSICIDNFLDDGFAELLADSYPDYHNAKKLGREFKSLNENLKVQITDPNLFPKPVSILSEILGSEEFRDNLTTLTGMSDLHWDPDFIGGGMHITGPSGILDVHVDFNFEKKLNLYRRLNILIYLNRTWEKEWGGEIELWDKEIRACGQSFLPIHNRCVLFATTDYSFHGVTAATCPEGITRNSLAAYYYTDVPGDNAGAVYGGNHTTIFKARPDEVLKKYYLMPMHKIKAESRALKENIKGKIKGLFNS